MPRTNRRALAAALAAADFQDGVLTMAQLLEAGMSSSTVVDRARRGGRWQRLLPATYALYSGEPTIASRRRAGLLYGGPGAMLTGASSLTLHGIRATPPETPVHVLIPATRDVSSRNFVLLERTRRVPDPVTIAGVPCTPLPRAVVDAARRMSNPRNVDALVGEVIQRGHCSAEELEREVRDAQIRGTSLVRSAVAAMLAGAQSGPEAEAVRLVRGSHLPEPLWNPTLLDAATGEFLACPDGYWDEGVALEVDSRAHHSIGEDFDHTLERDARLTSYGILTLHVTPQSLRRAPDQLLAAIERTLEVAQLRPPPAVLVRRQAG